MFEHWKELLLLVAELVPVWLLVKVSQRGGDPYQKNKKLLAIIGLMVLIGVIVYALGWSQAG